MTLETVSTNTAFGGVQGVYKHSSAATGTEMTFSVFVPPHAPGDKLPVVWYLSGLTCTHANVTATGSFEFMNHWIASMMWAACPTRSPPE